MEKADRYSAEPTALNHKKKNKEKLKPKTDIAKKKWQRSRIRF